MPAKHPWYRPRHYLHLDSPIGYKRARRVVTSPKRVARHSFYPFISYHVTSKKLKQDKATKTLKIKRKNRPIRYAAHLDAHIYSYYALMLSSLYEEALAKRGISDSVLAFRSLRKSNIEFAADAFGEIKSRGDCSVVALDISGFFDNLDHEILKNAWASLLGESRLPADHYAVFKSLTKYSAVDKESLYKKLNISLNNPKAGNRKRLCEAVEFREKVRRTGLVKKNCEPFGIPQGSSISALLSNIYMFQFDIKSSEEMERLGGKYYRYCDDMLFIVPKEHKEKIEEFAISNIDNLCIDINPDKTEKREFTVENEKIISDRPLQYLGFTYDGQQILIRSAALARYSEKMKRGVRLAKATMKKRNRLRIYRGESPKPIYRNNLYKRYSHLGQRNFITYGFRAAETFNSTAIRKQLKPLWKRLTKEIET
ncbi:MAG: antiviral reverse transcriptase Drt2 [Sedimenticola sp.]